MVVPPFHTPKWSFLVGKPMEIVGETHHFRNPPFELRCHLQVAASIGWDGNCHIWSLQASHPQLFGPRKWKWRKVVVEDAYIFHQWQIMGELGWIPPTSKKTCCIVILVVTTHSHPNIILGNLFRRNLNIPNTVVGKTNPRHTITCRSTWCSTGVKYIKVSQVCLDG